MYSFKQYQKEAKQFNLLADSKISINLTEKALGLAGEAGETVDKIKKLFRDEENIEEAIQKHKDEIGAELADVLWYISALTDIFNLSLEDIAQSNIDKLSSRQKRGVLQGSGDNR